MHSAQNSLSYGLPMNYLCIQIHTFNKLALDLVLMKKHFISQMMSRVVFVLLTSGEGMIVYIF